MLFDVLVVYMCFIFYSMQHIFGLTAWRHACILKNKISKIFKRQVWSSTTKWNVPLLVHRGTKCTKNELSKLFGNFAKHTENHTLPAPFKYAPKIVIAKIEPHSFNNNIELPMKNFVTKISFRWVGGNESHSMSCLNSSTYVKILHLN